MVQCSAILLIICCQVLSSAWAKKGFGPGDQDWGHVTIREGAHMFYWLYYTTANVANYTDRPLAIWLQGGPGASSTGYGNFEELGPLDLYLNYRNHTWVKDMNVLFIDNPVGSGYSYVDDRKYLTTTNKEIALDLVELMKEFYRKHPEFKKVPLHIFCESYGGKMAPEFALELDGAIKRGEIQSNLKSVVLGDPWVSPMDSVRSWAPFLLQTSLVDQNGYNEIIASVQLLENAFNAENWPEINKLLSALQFRIFKITKGVNFYNILNKTEIPVKYNFNPTDVIIETLMRNHVAQALNISNVVWGAQKRSTLTALLDDFMKPVIHIVEEILNSTDINVGVFSGQLDLICATPGTVNWIEKMRWTDKDKYNSSPRLGISVNRIIEGYTKHNGRFSMFWINRAGHMVPNDNPAAMSYILQKFTKFG